MKQLLFLFFLLLTCTVGLWAQKQDTTQHIDVVFLKDGSEFRGIILRYDIGEELDMRLRSGTRMTIPASVIKKVVQEPGAMPSFTKPYRFEEKGWYYLAYGGLMGGNSAWSSELEMGLGLDLIAGYQLNRMLGVGLGVGLHNYHLEAGEAVYPIYAEARGYLLASNVSPYYVLSAGYGFAFRNENENIERAEGGLLIHPALGLRFGGEDAHFIMDMGVRVQRATWERRLNGWWGGEETRTQRMTYARFVLRLGVLF